MSLNLISEIILENHSLIISLFSLSLLLFYMIIKLNVLLKDNTIDNIQKIHTGSISRNGGIGILILFLTACFYLDNSLLFNLSLIYLPISLIIALEDNFQNISPVFRLLTILITSFLSIFYLYSNGNLPKVELFDIFSILNNPIIIIPIFTLILASIMNGSNMIDGANGLCGFTFLNIFFVIMSIGYLEGDVLFASSIVPLITILFSFLIFNYPKGKIFLGDNGAYFLGYISINLFLILVYRNPSLPAWAGLALFFYPLNEVIFSFLRKSFYNKSNPLYPDNKHLHLIFFKIFKSVIPQEWVANSLVTVSLALIWLVPPVMVLFLYHYVLTCLIAFIISCTIYFLIYYAVYPTANK